MNDARCAFASAGAMDTRTGEELSEMHRKLSISPAGSPDNRALRLPHLPEQALDAKVIRGNVGMARRTAAWSIVTVLAALGP
jgi:hypothetical protein